MSTPQPPVPYQQSQPYPAPQNAPAQQYQGNPEPQQYAQPSQYAQPQAPQNAPPPQAHQAAARAVPQAQQPAHQPYAQQFAQTGRPPAQGAFNVPGLIALILTAATTIIWSFASPFAIRALYRSAMMTFDPFFMSIWQWLDVIATLPFYAIALVLAFAGTASQHRTRGKFYAWIAIGGASVGIIVSLLGSIATRMSYATPF